MSDYDISTSDFIFNFIPFPLPIFSFDRKDLRSREQDYWKDRLATFDDDEFRAMVSKPHSLSSRDSLLLSYFMDPIRWWSSRKGYRRNEIQRDQEDAKDEEREILELEAIQEKKRLEESLLAQIAQEAEEAKNQFLESMGVEIDDGKEEEKERNSRGEDSPSKLNVLNVSSDSDLTSPPELNSPSDSKKRKLEEFTSPPSKTARIWSVDERKKELKAIKDSLPNDKKGLFLWKVKWEFLDEVSRDSKKF